MENNTVGETSQLVGTRRDFPEGITQRQNQSLRSQGIGGGSVRDTSSYQDSVNFSTLDQKLHQEENYLLKDLKNSKQSYKFFIKLYVLFMILVTVYSVHLIVQWSFALGSLQTQKTECSDLHATDIKLIVFYGINIATFVVGLLTSLCKMPRGILVFITMHLVIIIWRGVLFKTYFKASTVLIEECYTDKSFLLESKWLWYLLAGETLVSLLALFLGVHLFKKTWAVSRTNNRLGRMTANSVLYKSGKFSKVQ